MNDRQELRHGHVVNDHDDEDLNDAPYDEYEDVRPKRNDWEDY